MRPCRGTPAATVAAVAALACVACAPPTRPGPTAPDACAREDDPFWRDAEGRALIYRGVNFSGAAKVSSDLLPPKGPHLERIAGMGASAIRLLVFWQGIEPRPGAYDMVYLEGVRDVAARAGDAGLDVIVDLHQDVYGEAFGFTGFPRWTCPEALWSSFERPAEWFLSYFEPEVMACFTQFWESDALQASYAEATRVLLQTLGDVPAVVALEIMNEPYWGDLDTAGFETARLRPLYERVAGVVRDEAPRLRILAEPSVGYGFGVYTPFEGDFGCPAWIFAPHDYPSHTESGTYDGDLAAIEAAVQRRRVDAAALGAPWVLTEFGTRAGPGAAAYIADVLAVLDAHHGSAFVWDYGPGPGSGFALVAPDGTLSPQGEAFVRPHAHRIAGVPLEQTWDPKSACLRVRWQEAQPRVVAGTALRLPAAWFIGAPSITSSDALGTWSSVSAPPDLEIWADPEQDEHDVTVCAP